MRAIVLSDTHSELIPQAIWEAVKSSDLVIHVGDFCDIDVLERLKALKAVRAVYGNMDGLDLRGVLPRKAVFKCEGVSVGLFHGEGASGQVLEKVRAAFKGEKVDVVVFGHTHEPFNEVIDGVVYFNPGSPTDNVRAAVRSYGVLEINGRDVKGTIVKLT